MANKAFDVSAAVSATSSKTHPGGVVYTFPDGSTLEVYGGGSASYRANSPGWHGTQADAVTYGAIGVAKSAHDGNVLVFATKDAANAGLAKKLKEIDSTFTTKDPTVGDILYGYNKGGTQTYISDFLRTLHDPNITAQTDYRTLTDGQKAEIQETFFKHEGYYNPQGDVQIIRSPGAQRGGDISDPAVKTEALDDDRSGTQGSPAGGGALTMAGVQQLMRFLDAGKTMEGRAQSAMEQNLLRAARAQIAGPDGPDGTAGPEGETRFQNFLGAYFPALDQGLQSGKTAAELLTPGSPDYLGKLIPAFAPPSGQKSSLVLPAANGGIGTPPFPPPPPSPANNIPGPSGPDQSMPEGIDVSSLG